MKAVNSASARIGRSARYRWELREIGAGDTGSGRPAAREGTEKHVGPHRHLDSRHREEGLGNPRVWTDRSSWDRGERPPSATGTGRRPGHHNSAGGTPCRGSLRKRRRTRTRECDRQQPGGVAAQCAARERATGKGLATHSSSSQLQSFLRRLEHTDSNRIRWIQKCRHVAACSSTCAP